MRLFEIREGKEGKGAYATEPIDKGVEIVFFSGRPLCFDETRRLKGKKESFALQVSDHYYLYLNEPARFFNHSCDPNCGLNEMKFLAIRDIKKGEQLCYDYSTTMFEREWTMPCSCNSPICRGTVEDFDRLPSERQSFYLSHGIVQPFIREKMHAKGKL